MSNILSSYIVINRVAFVYFRCSVEEIVSEKEKYLKKRHSVYLDLLKQNQTRRGTGFKGLSMTDPNVTFVNLCMAQEIYGDRNSVE